MPKNRDYKANCYILSKNLSIEDIKRLKYMTVYQNIWQKQGNNEPKYEIP